MQSLETQLEDVSCLVVQALCLAQEELLAIAMADEAAY